MIELQVEFRTSLHRKLDVIEKHGAKAGVAINPVTPLEDLPEAMPYIGLVTVMKRRAGIRREKSIAQPGEDRSRAGAWATGSEIEVDGGIDARTGCCDEIQRPEPAWHHVGTN